LIMTDDSLEGIYSVQVPKSGDALYQ